MTTTDSTTAAREPRVRDNAATVAEIHAAFARGDVPAVLDALAEDVAWEDWADNWAQRAEVRASFALPDGGRFADEEVHLRTFDDTGRVVRSRHHLDTAEHIAAARSEDTVGG